MAVNLATKYESSIDKAFALGSLTDAAVNKNFTWAGVDAIKIFGATTVALGNYDRTATDNRFGDGGELQNTVQTMTLANDKAFRIIIDQAQLDSTNGAIKAGEILRLEIDEQVTPVIDTYRLRVMYNAAIANDAYAYATISKTNAYEKFLGGQETLGNAKVPLKGRIAFCSYSFYSYIKLDTSFMLASEVAMNERINGMVGMVDGVKIVPVPSDYLAPNVAFMITHPVATTAANKLTYYDIKMNPPGINGALIEGRVRYDAFVSDKKVDAIYVFGTALLS